MKKLEGEVEEEKTWEGEEKRKRRLEEEKQEGEERNQKEEEELRDWKQEGEEEEEKQAQQEGVWAELPAPMSQRQCRQEVQRVRAAPAARRRGKTDSSTHTAERSVTGWILTGIISRLGTCGGGTSDPATCGRSSGGEPGEAGVWGSASELSSQGRLGSRLNHWPCFSAMALTLSSGRWPSGGSSCEWLSQLWSAACVRSPPPQPLPGDPGPSSPPDLALLRRRRRILAVRRWSSTSGLILRGLPRPLGWHMREAVLGSSSGEKGAWVAEGEAGLGLTATGVSSTLGSLLRKVTGTSAIRTSPEAEGRKARGRVFQNILENRKTAMVLNLLLTQQLFRSLHEDTPQVR